MLLLLVLICILYIELMIFIIFVVIKKLLLKFNINNIVDIIFKCITLFIKYSNGIL